MIDFGNPVFLKVAGGAALYLLGGGRVTRWAGIGLAAWGGWDYYRQQRPKVLYQSVPMPKISGFQAPWTPRASANLGGVS
jgi:hypothetical protein